MSCIFSNGALETSTFSVSSPGAVVQHGDAGGDQLHVAELLLEDGGDQAVEGPQLLLVAEVEALEHVVPEGRHLAVLAAEQLLKRGRRVGVGLLRLRQLRLQSVDAHEHGGGSPGWELG
jgi:hypothetical protein